MSTPTTPADVHTERPPADGERTPIFDEVVNQSGYHWPQAWPQESADEPRG
ncbi:hypothetical protein SAMN05421630_105233 [Prauserella marina]|uniref:Uncharacterized protein n=1 Tax=Prauserella marina TaxID=530584 RepID=A0A1G6RDE7_9PSEU|nr:hypothetical protein [Prauserella marina]PWV77015.1 hypothetical protein DES30_105232 [Prauserella marina]SDD02423.1 hypothetical protein SAMN05421630_105233 [Prauserella marina]